MFTARRENITTLSLATDKGYDSQPVREILREMGIRPLVKHRVFAPYDHARNARIENDLYNQRSMTETVNSSVKRSYGSLSERVNGTVNSVKSS